MNLLNGKKILFIAFQFYDYPDRIIKELNSNGAMVTYLNPSAGQSLIRQKMKKKSTNLDYDFIGRVKNVGKDFDYLFLINLNSFSTETIKWITAYFQDSTKLVYLWDSLSNSSFDKKNLKLFDKVFSFDLVDCKSNENINFLPLFYCDVAGVETDFKYDFMFIGVARPDRYDYLKKIKEFATANNLTYCFRLYFRSPFIYYFNKFIKGLYRHTKASDFTYTKTSQNELKQIMSESRIIVDMETMKQNGLTMRTIECLGMKKKLITTNKNIVDYDFYNPNNILYVDRNNVKIDEDFIKSNYYEIAENIYKKYSLTQWIKTIFDL